MTFSVFLWSGWLSIWRAVSPLPVLLLRHKNEDLSTPVTVYLSNCLACPWVKRHHHPSPHYLSIPSENAEQTIHWLILSMHCPPFVLTPDNNRDRQGPLHRIPSISLVNPLSLLHCRILVWVDVLVYNVHPIGQLIDGIHFPIGIRPFLCPSSILVFDNCNRTETWSSTD